MPDDVIHNKHLKPYIFAALFAALTAAGAFIRIPIPPVPFTLQTLFVFLAAGMFGPLVGFYSQALYLVTGLIGFPVFANGGGIGYVYQVTFGFLLSYPLAGLIMGMMAKKVMSKYEERTNKKTVMLKFAWIYTIGTVIIFGIGILYIVFHTTYIAGKEIQLQSILWSSFVIFIPTSILKIAVASWLTVKLRKISRR